ncbi:hypothetical protein SAMN04324257_01089 [Thermoanaerobacter thermohydrosulfuricus]|nr:hypothetical protein SAMN04324257_01089 [Thermoanaerobacter thermohydrosulfuricus]
MIDESRTEKIVMEVTQIDFQGNITPQNWYKYIKTDAGKPDPIAVSLLADIVYWYKATEFRDEVTGEVIGYKKKFKGDKLQKSYEQFANQFGYSKVQVKRALKRLEKQGLITLEFRNITTKTGLKLTNVMYIEPIPEKIREITYASDKVVDEEDDIQLFTDVPANLSVPLNKNVNTSVQKSSEVCTKEYTPLYKKVGTNTENTTQTTTENTTGKQKNKLSRLTKKTLSRESKSSRESISLSSKKVNNKLAKLIKIDKLMLYYCLVNKITIKTLPGKYTTINKSNTNYTGYNEDNVFTSSKNNKNLSLETYTNSKDLHSVLDSCSNTNTGSSSSNKNIPSGRDNISHVRNYTNRKDTKPVRDRFSKSNIYALTEISAGINNLNSDTGKKVSEYSDKDSSLQKAENGTTAAQQTEEEPYGWEKVSSDEEIRYSYGDWDDYSIEEFDDGTVHTSPKASQKIFNTGTAAVCSDEDEVSSSAETAAVEGDRDSAIESAAFHSSERVFSGLSAANCPAATGQQVLNAKAVKPETEKHSSRVQQQGFLLSQQQKNSPGILNTGTAEKANAENSAETCFEVIKRQIWETELRKSETVKPDSSVLCLVYLSNPQQRTLTATAGAEHAFSGNNSSENAVSVSTENTAGCREKTVSCLQERFKAGSRRVNTKAAAGTCFEVINQQTPETEAIKVEAGKHNNKAQQLIYLLNRQQRTLMPEAAADKHIFSRDGPL